MKLIKLDEYYINPFSIRLVRKAYTSEYGGTTIYTGLGLDSPDKTGHKITVEESLEKVLDKLFRAGVEVIS